MQATIRSNTITQGVIAAVLASSIWGGMYVVSRVVLEVIPPITLVCIRMFVSSLFILGLLVVRRQNWRLPREIWGRVLAMGLIGNALSITAQFQGTHLAGAALGSLITTASPLVTVALSAAFGLEKIPLRAWIGLGLGLLGVRTLGHFWLERRKFSGHRLVGARRRLLGRARTDRRASRRQARCPACDRLGERHRLRDHSVFHSLGNLEQPDWNHHTRRDCWHRVHRDCVDRRRL
jgi:uncharacterized membrane protein